MALRTDLAMETIDLSKNSLPKNVYYDKKQKENTEVEILKITDFESERKLGKPKGTYITATVPEFGGNTPLSDEETEFIAGYLKELLPEEGTVLVVGMGNVHITPDAIGPKSVDLILATRHMTEIALKPLEGFRSVAAVSTGVLGQTGVETAEIILSVVEKIKPKAVIAIDALAAASIKRLGTTIQISDSGITPGAGVQNRRKELSKNTLGIPVVAIGIPTVVDSDTIIESYGTQRSAGNMKEPLMVTPRDIDLLVERGAKAISMVINLALQQNFKADDIRYLIC